MLKKYICTGVVTISKCGKCFHAKPHRCVKSCKELGVCMIAERDRLPIIEVNCVKIKRGI
jgi:hypothetical protein